MLSQHPDRYVVTALAAATSHASMLEQCLRFRPAIAVLQDANASQKDKDYIVKDGDVLVIRHG